jgi:hypothetical protein
LSASLHISVRVYDVGPDDDPNAAACRQASTKDQIAALTWITTIAPRSIENHHMISRRGRAELARTREDRWLRH